MDSMIPILLFRSSPIRYVPIRYDMIEEINVDSKAEYSAYSSTRSQKLKTKPEPQCPIAQQSNDAVLRVTILHVD